MPVEIYEYAVGEWRPLEIANAQRHWWDGIREVYRLTSNAWQQGVDAPAGLPDARHVLAVVEAAYRSAESGDAISLSRVEQDSHDRVQASR